MSKPIAVLVGAIGKLPYAGVSFYYLHHLGGLLELGYDVHYVEAQNKPDEYYDPSIGMTDDVDAAVDYLADLLPAYGVGPGRWSLVDAAGKCHGSGWPALRDTLDHADFVLTVADATWFDDLERCPRRAFVDGDPVFTQVAIDAGDGKWADIATRYDVLFTYAFRIGQPDCSVPTLGRRWIPARPVVMTSWWKPTDSGENGAVTALLHWAAGGEVQVNGQVYGHKDREFEQLLDLPARVDRPLRLAVGGRRAPRDRLRAHGWTLVDPLAATATPAAYRSFIAESRADLGIAKHAYVASRSGWFSDRSTCFLAAGRPVLHQDTGCGEWLSVGEGVVLFSDADGAVAALDEIDADYRRHAQMARTVAKQEFEARIVLAHMLEEAGYR